MKKKAGAIQIKLVCWSCGATARSQLSAQGTTYPPEWRIVDEAGILETACSDICAYRIANRKPPE